MQIVVTCDSFDELIAAAHKILEDHGATAPTACQPGKAADVWEEEPKKAPAKKAPAKKAEPAPEEEQPFKAKDPEPAADETSVKVMLAEKIKGGKKAEVRALFDEYGVAKLSELVAKHPEKLAEFAAKAEAI